MAKVCPVCGKPMGFLTGKVSLADGYICTDCWKKVGFGTGMSDLEKGHSYTSNDIKDILNGVTSNPVQESSIIESAISDAVKASGSSTALQKASIKDVAVMFRENETIIAAITANVYLGEPQGALHVNAFDFKNKIAGVVVITNSRVLFASSTGYKASKSFYLTDINSIDDSSVGALISSVLRIQTASTSLAIDSTKQILVPFRGKLEDAIHNARIEKEQNNNIVIQQTTSGADEILKYKGLMDAGIITEDEFNAKKSQILGI